MAQGYPESMWIRFLANILVRASQHPVTSESHKGAAPKSIRSPADILARALQHHDSARLIGALPVLIGLNLNV
jgi:hypothetical protein